MPARTAFPRSVLLALLVASAACGGGGGGGPGPGPGPEGGGNSFPTSGVLYVATWCDIQVIDLATNAVLGSIDGCQVSGSMITGVAANTTAGKVYATWTGGPVAAFDQVTGALEGETWDPWIAGAFERLEVSADGAKGWVVDSDGPLDVLTFGATTAALGGTLSSGYVHTGSTATSVGPMHIAFDAGRERLSAMVYDGPADNYRVDVWNVANGSRVANFVFDFWTKGLPLDMGVNATTNVAWVAVGDLGYSNHQGVVAVDLGTSTVGTPVDFGFNHGGMGQGVLAVNAATNRVYCLDPYGASFSAPYAPQLVAVNGGTGAFTTISLGASDTTPSAVVVNPSTNKGYVANDASVLVVNLANGTVASSITLPDSASWRLGMAIVP